MSEIGDAGVEQSRKQKVAYARQAQATGELMQETELADEVTPFRRCSCRKRGCWTAAPVMTAATACWGGRRMPG